MLGRAGQLAQPALRGSIGFCGRLGLAANHRAERREKLARQFLRRRIDRPSAELRQLAADLRVDLLASRLFPDIAPLIRATTSGLLCLAVTDARPRRSACPTSPSGQHRLLRAPRPRRRPPRRTTRKIRPPVSSLSNRSTVRRAAPACRRFARRPPSVAPVPGYRSAHPGYDVWIALPRRYGC